MNILLATDGTRQGDAALDMLKTFRLSETDKVKIVSVVDMAVPLAIGFGSGKQIPSVRRSLAAREPVVGIGRRWWSIRVET